MEERASSPKKTDEVGTLLSCWGRLKLKLPSTKRRAWRRQDGMGCDITAAFGTKRPKPVGGFRYDPLSYSQNFDEGCWDDKDEDSTSRGFSSRYAAPSKSLRDK